MKKAHQLVLYLLSITVSALGKQPNGQQGGIVLTPQNVDVVLQSLSQPINTAGLLDKTFGGVGYSTKNFSGGADYAAAVALQQDGKIVVTGGTNINAGPSGVFATMRYNTDGSLDPTFGNGTGYVTTSISGAGYVNGAYGVAIQADGKIIVVGQTNIYNAVPHAGNFGVIRYNSDGSLDTSFGPNGTGIVTKNFSGGVDGATCVVIQPDGKIIVGGGTNIPSSPGHVGNVALIRYLPTGYPDNSFGPNGNGTFTINISGQGDLINALLLQPDGKIVGIGGTNTAQTGPAPILGDFLVIRLTADGLLDHSFASGVGYALAHVSPTNDNYIDEGWAGVLEPDGKIVAIGTANMDNTGTQTGYVTLIRYTAEGILDPTFGQNGTGIVKTNVSGAGYGDRGTGATLQPDNSILVVGCTNFWNNNAAGGSILTLRYLPQGILDPSFGPNRLGYTLVNVSGATLCDLGNGITISPQGKIVVVGQTDYLNAVGNFITLRYINPFTLNSFSATYGGVGLL